MKKILFACLHDIYRSSLADLQNIYRRTVTKIDKLNDFVGYSGKNAAENGSLLCHL